MLVLALDTTTRAGSVALARNGILVDVSAGDASRTHAARLPGDLLDMLARHGLSLGDVDLFGVAAGPGSFTGLRIGIATIQGLAFANRRPVVAVSALDALAYSAFGGNPDAAAADAAPPALIGAWMDAQRHEIYAALYASFLSDVAAPDGPSAADLGDLAIVEPAAVADPSVIVERWRVRLAGTAPAGAVLAGDGGVAYRALAVEAFPGIRVLDTVPAIAPAIAEVARRRAERGLAVAPHAVKPVYVRRPDAELARDRKRQAADAAASGTHDGSRTAQPSDEPPSRA